MTDYADFEVDMDDLSRHDFGSLPKPVEGDKIILGVCAMQKKSKSKAMRQILGRLDTEEFEVVIFPEDIILNEKIENWPRCHCLIAFFSDGFPLEKATKYAELRKPFLVNELKTQFLLKDRRHVMKLLEKFGVPTPHHIAVNRDSKSPSGYPLQVNKESDMEEFDDYIVVNGKRLDKPFVEKPVDGDNHNVYIYYPRSAGGGSCHLFRKVKNRSSKFFPNENKVRRNGSFVYESFLHTEGSDVKVYTVTSNYAHSEARKSPSIDGNVTRNEAGFEVRYPILLNGVEKEIANRIIQATGQRICGFDVLRSDSKSYVCDVNGWSFVKNNHKYYDDFSMILADLLRKAMGKAFDQSSQLVSDGYDESLGETDSSDEASKLSAPKGPAPSHEELRCVIAVVRHGDRTPKQKLKIKSSDKEVLALFDKYGKRDSKSELKLKSAIQLNDVLKIATAFGVGEETDNPWQQARSVLEMHGTFKGINRKVQLKPIEWDEQTGAITKAQFILKWGGVLTFAGRDQAERMGQSFRQKLYPFDGLLRLHSTYRHNLKVYSSNEGRVQVTAAAFAKGMLQLDSHLTPILTSLVRKNDDVDALLDDASAAKEAIEHVKRRLHKALLDEHSTQESLRASVAATDATSVLGALEELDYNPRESLSSLLEHIKGLVHQLRICVKTKQANFGKHTVNADSAGVANTATLLGHDSNSEGGSAAASLDRVESDLHAILSQDNGTALLMSLYRWSKLEKDLYSEKKKQFDLSKVPDIHDSVKFDLLHNPMLNKLNPPHLKHIYRISTALADVVVPQEYGVTADEKIDIGSRIAHSLVAKIRQDLTDTIAECSRVSPFSKMQRDQSVGALSHLSETRQVSAMNSPEDLNLDTESETFHRLDKRYARSMGIKSSDRMVRTRLYFTSESHLHALLNVMRFSVAKERNVSPDAVLVDLPPLTPESEALLGSTKELSYLTHITFRLFEIIPHKKRRYGRMFKRKSASVDEASENARFRISVGVSPGVLLSLAEDGSVLHGKEFSAPLASEKNSAESTESADVTQATGAAEGAEAADPKPPNLSNLSLGPQVHTAAESARYGPEAEVQLDPCAPLVPLWQNLEYKQLDNLFVQIIDNMKENLSSDELSPLTSSPKATPIEFSTMEATEDDAYGDATAAISSPTRSKAEYIQHFELQQLQKQNSQEMQQLAKDDQSSKST